eukprot:gnl/Chilomastix_cuspidata/764.p1 GENE.gnl/Chilomastix_cuspidata/764~~gnl/Chilomastix_cuspidata/764.p1  ORF type:complete len:890 (-),score=72.13 gnl/Chilomastix_cuspidata/764:323-2611(-)
MYSLPIVQTTPPAEYLCPAPPTRVAQTSVGDIVGRKMDLDLKDNFVATLVYETVMNVWEKKVPALPKETIVGAGPRNIPFVALTSRSGNSKTHSCVQLANMAPGRLYSILFPGAKAQALGQKVALTEFMKNMKALEHNEKKSFFYQFFQYVFENGETLGFWGEKETRDPLYPVYKFLKVFKSDFVDLLEDFKTSETLVVYWDEALSGALQACKGKASGLKLFRDIRNAMLAAAGYFHDGRGRSAIAFVLTDTNTSAGNYVPHVHEAPGEVSLDSVDNCTIVRLSLAPYNEIRPVVIKRLIGELDIDDDTKKALSVLLQGVPYWTTDFLARIETGESVAKSLQHVFTKVIDNKLFKRGALTGPPGTLHAANASDLQSLVFVLMGCAGGFISAVGRESIVRKGAVYIIDTKHTVGPAFYSSRLGNCKLAAPAIEPLVQLGTLCLIANILDDPRIDALSFFYNNFLALFRPRTHYLDVRSKGEFWELEFVFFGLMGYILKGREALKCLHDGEDLIPKFINNELPHPIFFGDWLLGIAEVAAGAGYTPMLYAKNKTTVISCLEKGENGFKLTAEFAEGSFNKVLAKPVRLLGGSKSPFEPKLPQFCLLGGNFGGYDLKLECGDFVVVVECRSRDSINRVEIASKLKSTTILGGKCDALVHPSEGKDIPVMGMLAWKTARTHRPITRGELLNGQGANNDMPQLLFEFSCDSFSSKLNDIAFEVNAVPGFESVSSAARTVLLSGDTPDKMKERFFDILSRLGLDGMPL